MLAGVLALLGGAVLAARAAITQSIVVDWHTGLAISGYDPVAFFTDGKPLQGKAEVELHYGGVVWRFCNIGNRAAFAERPDVYMPKYGGYDPFGVANGVAVAGNPTLWVIAGERLFLFYDAARREKFTADAARYTAAADRKWPEVLQTLGP
jgi:YHS domain-containing protein